MTKFITGLLIAAQVILFSCSPAKRVINNAIGPKDTTNVGKGKSPNDAINLAKNTRENLARNYIDFKTLSAKIKVESEDSKGKNPDVTAIVRVLKDSAIWISLSATFLNVEVYRVFITRDSVILLDKREKTYQRRSLDYLQEVTQIPFDFKTLQNLLVGNPIFFDSSTAVYRRAANFVLASSIDKNFKTLLTLSSDKNQLLRSKLDDVNLARNRTADVTYDQYENSNNHPFSTYRKITISEKNKLEVYMNFKQFDFNKELSVAFSIPKNFKRK